MKDKTFNRVMGIFSYIMTPIFFPLLWFVDTVITKEGRADYYFVILSRAVRLGESPQKNIEYYRGLK